MDLIDVDELLEDDSFIGDTEQLDDEVEEILKQWKSSSTLPAPPPNPGGVLAIVPAVAIPASPSSFGFIANHSQLQHYSSNSNHNNSNSDSKGSKYVDTRTFTRPKKKLDSTFNSSNSTMDFITPEHPFKMSSPLMNLQIGGPVTPNTGGASGTSAINTSQLMQRSWLNDVSPPGSIMSSMEFSVNEKLGNSLITSGDFTNVSYLLNANGGDEAMLNSHSSYDGYRLADVIKDRKFLENLSSFDENTMTKDNAISKTDLHGIEENLSGLSTMQSSLESVTKSGICDGTIVLGNGKGDTTFEVEPPAPEIAPIRERMNGTFERRRNFDTYRKPKSSLNSTFDALPKVGGGSELVAFAANRTFDAEEGSKQLMDATFGVAGDNCNGTFSLNRTAKVNGTEKQLNQTYEYCEKSIPAIPCTADRTFDGPRNETFLGNPASPETAGGCTPNGTFEYPTDRLANGESMVQSTPFVQVPRATRSSGIGAYEVNCSPIAAVTSGRRSEGVRRSRNLEQDIASHMETDDFDVEFRKLPITPNSKTDSSNGSHLLDNEKRISLQHFEEFEKSIMESEHNGVDFDEMLNSLTDVKRSMDSVKLRQSLDNIKKRHSRINTEKQQEELKKRGEMNDSALSPLDNKLADSMLRSSMSSSSGSERLLNRRSRYNDDVHLTLSPQQQQQQSETQLNESGGNPLPTAPEVGSSDKKNRDRFKTIRISKRREEGMVIVPDPEDAEDCLAESAALPMEEEQSGSPTVATTTSAFGRVDYNSPKESRLSTTSSFEQIHQRQQQKTEEPAVFKRPQVIPTVDNKIRSLSKPRYYGAAPLSAGGGLNLSRRDLSLPLGAKSSSTDNLENDRPNYQYAPLPGRLCLGSKLGGSGGMGLSSGGTVGGRVAAGVGPGAVQSNLKSPMGTKSKSHHNLYFNQGSSGHAGSSSNLNRIPTPLGLSAQKLSHNNSNTELKNNTSKLQLQLRAPRASSLVRPVAATMKSPVPELAPRANNELNLSNHNSNNSSSITTMNSTLSGVQMRAPKTNSRLGLVRPSSGYFSYSSHRKNADSDSESINSLSSSSASSRGSLYRVDSQSIANSVQTGATNSIENISDAVSHSINSASSFKTNLIEPNRATALKSTTATPTPTARPSGLRPPSNLRPPTARSGLPRPTSYVRR